MNWLQCWVQGGLIITCALFRIASSIIFKGTDIWNSFIYIYIYMNNITLFKRGDTLHT